MPRHTPIRFKDPGVSEEMRAQVEEFIDHHPVASSALQALLATIVLGGALTIAAVAPGAVAMWGHLQARKKREKRESYRTLWKTFYELRKEGSVAFVGEKGGEMVYELTEKGKKRLHRFLFETLTIATPKKWDGTWRVIAFDVPEQLRIARKTFQEKLREMGCYQLQRSVWIHPFPCEKEIAMLAEFLHIRRHVDILPVSAMGNGRALYHFRDLLKTTV